MRGAGMMTRVIALVGAAALLVGGLPPSVQALDLNGELVNTRLIAAEGNVCPFTPDQDARENFTAVLGRLLSAVAGPTLNLFGQRLRDSQSLDARTTQISADAHWDYYRFDGSEARISVRLPNCLILVATDQSEEPDREKLNSFARAIIDRDTAESRRTVPDVVADLEAVGIRRAPLFYFETSPRALLDGVTFDPIALSFRGQRSERTLTLNLSVIHGDPATGARVIYGNAPGAFAFRAGQNAVLGPADFDGMSGPIVPHAGLPQRWATLLRKLDYCDAIEASSGEPGGWGLLATAEADLDELEGEALVARCEMLDELIPSPSGATGMPSAGQTVTFRASLNEIRDENEFIVAVGSVLADANVRTAILTEANSVFLHDGTQAQLNQETTRLAYELALDDLDRDQRAYDAALEADDPIRIASTRRARIQTLFAAREAAIRAGINPDSAGLSLSRLRG